MSDRFCANCGRRKPSGVACGWCKVILRRPQHRVVGQQRSTLVRLLAIKWFAFTGFFLTVIFLPLPLMVTYDPLSALLLATLPTLLAGCAGALFGEEIIAGSRVTNRRGAALLGAKASVLALAVFLCICADVISSSGRQDPIGFIGFLMTVELVGFLFLGPIIAIAGAASGVMLFNEYRGRP
jgi:hypothetical protein